MATMPYSDTELELMKLRVTVLGTALHSASVNTIKSPMAYVEELWAWVSDVGQPEEPAPGKRFRRMAKKPG
tara:strand:- start:344 stop:556 length:213 start_codon:yes stop_codon:yes gene_type:complete